MFLHKEDIKKVFYSLSIISRILKRIQRLCMKHQLQKTILIIDFEFELNYLMNYALSDPHNVYFLIE